MRGKLSRSALVLLGVRIIPAHAGQTLVLVTRFAVLADHPRACGANAVTPRRTVQHTGSSPRMRGKLLGSDKHARNVRIIPAHAGQTASARLVNRQAADHPRACGANPSRRAIWVVSNGSSPRMRGKLGEQLHGESQERIIPAHAGQTPASHRPRHGNPDHPRACGANI